MADLIIPYFRDGGTEAQQIVVGSGRRTQVLLHPGPLTLLAGFSVVSVFSDLPATDLPQRAPAPSPSCMSPFPPLLFPTPIPCTFSGASAAPETKDYDRTLAASFQEEMWSPGSGDPRSSSAPGQADGVVLSLLERLRKYRRQCRQPG